MANQGNGSYSSSHSTSRKIRLNRGEMWRKQKASEGDGSGIPVKSSLAEGLGRKVEVDKAPTNATVTPEKAAKSTGDFRVKTLEEIRQEKANRHGGTPAQLQAEGQCQTEEQSTETRPSQAVCTSAFSQALPLRKRRRSEDGKQNADELPTKRRVQGENSMQGVLTPSVAGQEKVEEPVHKVKPLEEIHIKTLDEIKREKALRLQQREESVSAPPAPPAPAPAQRRSIQSPKLTAPAIEAETHVERSTSVPEAVCAAARKRKAAEMCGSAVSATADGTEEPPAKTAAVAVAPAWPEDILVTVREAETPPNSPDLHLGCWAESVAQAEHSSCASPPPEVAATTQQLCSTAAGKTAFAAEDGYDDLMLELSGGDVEGGEDLEMGMDVHELLQELSEVAQGCWAESVAQAEDSSSASPSPQTAAKAQQLCSTGAEKVPFSAEDDYEQLMLELSGGDLQGGVDLEPGKDADELLQELSDMTESITH
ncbi:zinc finger CCCH domain-containing protein 11A-like [Centrocercus urophasianus]|uniref:zinc finger CCCH domain-containing protein 11A-like n=1 Tax=Centrocercus urophasianus TaxID=9002 RepID=UPI001C64CB3A|nr:zinc finger CCCH domain-containing protein 11A-like [Centrocercus urophasianus]